MRKTDLECAYTALKAKQTPYARLNGYYHGRQPLQYTSERFGNQFKDLTARFSENLCAVVIDSLMDRLSLTGFAIDD